MDRSLFLIFNHEITSRQKEDAHLYLGVEQITDLPQDLKKLWRQVPPVLSAISNYLEPVKTWLKSQAAKDDYVLIQGDFGACYIMNRD
ncbi:MAG: CRISPR-associated protein Csx20 [Thermodesulfobacteriota bacterium]|nr:CRISPR-associated protein Csx20 [Thermodesulfobacteriota bacterium]